MSRADHPAPIFDSISDLAPRLADGSETAENLLIACLAQIDAHDAGISAILRLNPDALMDARAMDAERARTGTTRGKLHGIPMAVKDNIDMAGLPTSSGNRAMAHAMPICDAEQIRRLRAAGAVIVGKANLSEFSFEIRSRSSLGGDVRNPFNPQVTAGGSSGGSAAAVAAGFAVAALGTDTGGSIRVPASYNGLVGLRPTHGLIDTKGTAPLAPSTDTIGPIGRNVPDVAALLDVMVDSIPRYNARAMAGARIGVLRQAFGEDPEIGTAMERALSLMSKLGAVLVDPVVLPGNFLPIGRPHIVDWEFCSAFDAYLRSNFLPGTAPSSVAALLASGDYLPEHREALERRAARSDLDTQEYREILAYHQDLKAALVKLMDDGRLDAIVYPTSAVTPRSLENPPGGWAPELAACSGFPAITLPIGQARHGPPIGLEILGRAFSELSLLGLAAGLEAGHNQRYLATAEK
jgi:Asp-tRNA(Asn)/Glu-tRNA(Gln) amidotransferase A subunit family amidase